MITTSLKKWGISLLIPVVLVLATQQAMAQQGTFVPGGSYKATTRNQKVMLTCSCAKTGGARVNSSLDITSLVDPVVNNYEGVLKVDPNKVAKPNFFVPGGYFGLTCNNIKVMMTAETQRANGNWATASIDLTKLPISTTLTNLDGILKVIQ